MGLVAGKQGRRAIWLQAQTPRTSQTFEIILLALSLRTMYFKSVCLSFLGQSKGSKERTYPTGLPWGEPSDHGELRPMPGVIYPCGRKNTATGRDTQVFHVR